ncbi:MAG: hypothetical protein HQ541_18005, partial [Mariniphaga sp.]|nr:hypothetical protein [Mariniphaga sp.]
MAVTISVEPGAVSNASAWTVTSDKDDATAKTITVFADYSGTVAGTVKVTTSAAHTYLTNDVVVITGTTSYNGTYDLTKIDADEFYITATWVANDATGTVTLTNSNFRIKAELIIAAATVAVKWQPAGTLSWDFKRILWELITYTTIDFDSLNIQTTNTASYKSYTIKFTEYWENTSNGLVTGANDTSSAKVIYKVDCTTFADYNLSADDEEFLTARPTTNKIKIGDNVVTGWTNWSGDSAYDTFTTSGRNITSAIDSSSVNAAYCYSNSIGRISKGDVIEFYCNFTKNSGTFPSIGLIEGTSGVWKSNYTSAVEGYNYIKITATVDIAVCRILIWSSGANQVDFSMDKVYVSKAYNELDYLGFISEEASLQVDCLLYDIDDGALGSLNLSAISLTGDRGIMPVSAILFTHSTTQVEKIILKMETATPADRSKNLTFVRNSVCWNNPVRIEWLNKFGAFDAYT